MDDVELQKENVEVAGSVLRALIAHYLRRVTKLAADTLKMLDHCIYFLVLDWLHPQVPCVVVDDATVPSTSILENVTTQNLHGIGCDHRDNHCLFLSGLVLQTGWAGQNKPPDLFRHAKPEPLVSGSLDRFVHSLIDKWCSFRNKHSRIFCDTRNLWLFSTIPSMTAMSCL